MAFSRDHYRACRERIETFYLSTQWEPALEHALKTLGDVDAMFGPAHPFWARARLDAGAIMHVMGQTADATAYAQDARSAIERWRASGHASTAWLLADAEWWQGVERPAHQIQLLRDAVHAASSGAEEYAEACVLLAEALAIEGAFLESDAFFRRVVDVKKPGSPLWQHRAAAGLGQCLVQQARYAEATALLVKADSIDPSPQRRYALKITLAQALDALGRSEDALAVRAEANTLLPAVNPSVFEFRDPAAAP